MIYEFDHYETALNGRSAFSLDLPFNPFVGQKIKIHKSVFPKHYFEGVFEKQPLQIDLFDEVEITVLFVQYVVFPEKQFFRIDFGVE